MAFLIVGLLPTGSEKTSTEAELLLKSQSSIKRMPRLYTTVCRHRCKGGGKRESDGQGEIIVSVTRGRKERKKRKTIIVTKG